MQSDDGLEELINKFRNPDAIRDKKLSGTVKRLRRLVKDSFEIARKKPLFITKKAFIKLMLFSEIGKKNRSEIGGGLCFVKYINLVENVNISAGVFQSYHVQIGGKPAWHFHNGYGLRLSGGDLGFLALALEDGVTYFYIKKDSEKFVIQQRDRFSDALEITSISKIKPVFEDLHQDDIWEKNHPPAYHHVYHILTDFLDGKIKARGYLFDQECLKKREVKDVELKVVEEENLDLEAVVDEVMKEVETREFDDLKIKLKKNVLMETAKRYNESLNRVLIPWEEAKEELVPYVCVTPDLNLVELPSLLEKGSVEMRLLWDEGRALEAQLERVQRNYKNLELQFEELQKEHESLRKINNELKKQHENLQKEYNKLQEGSKDIRREYSKLEDQLKRFEKLQKNYEKLEEAYKVSQTKYEKLVKRVEELQKEHAKLLEENKRLKEQLKKKYVPEDLEKKIEKEESPYIQKKLEKVVETTTNRQDLEDEFIKYLSELDKLTRSPTITYRILVYNGRNLIERERGIKQFHQFLKDEYYKLLDLVRMINSGIIIDSNQLYLERVEGWIERQLKRSENWKRGKEEQFVKYVDCYIKVLKTLKNDLVEARKLSESKLIT